MLPPLRNVLDLNPNVQTSADATGAGGGWRGHGLAWATASAAVGRTS